MNFALCSLSREHCHISVSTATGKQEKNQVSRIIELHEGAGLTEKTHFSLH